MLDKNQLINEVTKRIQKRATEIVSIFFKASAENFFFFCSHLKLHQEGNVLHCYKVLRLARNIYNNNASEMLHIYNETNRMPDSRNDTY